MKHVLMTMVFSVLFLMVGSAFAFNVPTPNGYVTDTSGKLSSAQVQQLNAKLTEYNHRTQNEIAVVVVPSLEGSNLSDATHEVFQGFKIGKAGLDNGILLFIAVNDHKMRLETGKGIEGEITDVESKTILDSMGPFFRANNFNAGIDSAVNQIEAKLDSRKGQKADPGQGQQFVHGYQITHEHDSTSSHSGGCSVGIGNDVGFGLGLIALFVVAMALVRRWVRKNETRKMAALEAKVEAEMAEETKHQAQEYDAKLRKAEVQAAIKAAEAKATTHENYIHAPSPPRSYAVAAVSVPVVKAPTSVVTKKHDDSAEAERAQARRRKEAAERAEEARAAERRERADEERRAERRREREEEQAAETVAAVVSIGSILDNDSSSGSSSGSSYDPPSYSGGSDSGFGGGSDSGFGGGDSGGGGADSGW